MATGSATSSASTRPSISSSPSPIFTPVLTTKSNSKKIIGGVVGGVIGGLIIIGSLVGVFLFRKRRRSMKSNLGSSPTGLMQQSPDSQVMTINSPGTFLPRFPGSPELWSELYFSSLPLNFHFDAEDLRFGIVLLLRNWPRNVSGYRENVQGKCPGKMQTCVPYLCSVVYRKYVQMYTIWLVECGQRWLMRSELRWVYDTSEFCVNCFWWIIQEDQSVKTTMWLSVTCLSDFSKP